MTPNGTATVTSSAVETGEGIYAPWTATSNFYVGMDKGFFLAHSLANVHSRLEVLLVIMFKLLQLFVPSIHEVDEVAEKDYLHPVASMFWSMADVPQAHSLEAKRLHPIAALIASVAGVPSDILV